MKKLALLALGLLIGLTVQAAEYRGIGGRPAYPREDDPRTQNWFIYSLQPGESRQDALLVQNNTDDTVTLLLYPADSTPSTDGGFALEQQVEPWDFVGKWVTLSVSELKLGPQESAVVPFVIAIPDDPKIDVGEHTGGILIQRKQESAEEQGGLRLFTRVGVRIYVTIPGERVEKLEIEKLEATLNKKTGFYTVRTFIKNQGNFSQAVVVHTRVTSLVSPLMASVLRTKDFPLEDSQNLQVLRDTSLTSQFEFKKPLYGKLQLESWVDYENGKKVIGTTPLVIRVPITHKLLVFIALLTAFGIGLFALAVLRQYNLKRVLFKQHGHKKRL